MNSSAPNIILIHGHDLGRWLSCYDMPSVPSPHLQRLADEGVVFDAAFATAPLCTPARSSLFTGLLPHQNGLMGLTHHGWRYHDEVRTLPQILSESGYRTALIGLQHEDLDARMLGFEEVHGLGFLPRALEVARRTEWRLEQADDSRPFFLSIGMWEAHRPWPAEDYLPADPAHVDVPDYLPDNEWTRRDISEFHGSIRQLDEAVGLILAAIDRSHADDTLVVFTTDHGAAFPRAKSTLYDSGVGVALIARPPSSWSVPGGRRVSAMVSHLDLVPTFVELAGGQIPDEVEGLSFVSALADQDPPVTERELVLEKTFHDGYDPMRAIRTPKAKYIRNYIPGPQLSLAIDLEESWTRRGLGEGHLAPRADEELYLLDDDPAELRNVAADPKHAELRERLAKRLELQMRRSGDPILAGPVVPPPIPARSDGE